MVKKLFDRDFVRCIENCWRISSGFQTLPGKPKAGEARVIRTFKGQLTQICNIQCTRW